MEPSEEIRRVIERWMVANAEGDGDAVLGRLSEHPGMPDDRHRRRRVVARPRASPSGGVRLEEMGGFPVTWEEIEAWEEGTVGWAG